MLRALRLASVAVAALGSCIAAYLVYVHYFGIEPYCVVDLSSVGNGIVNSCQQVQSSSYAKLWGLPVAVIGLGGYLSILATVAWRPAAESERGLLLCLLLSGIGFTSSMYLTYIELHVLRALCVWCVASAVLMTALFLLANARWFATPLTGTQAAMRIPER